MPPDDISKPTSSLSDARPAPSTPSWLSVVRSRLRFGGSASVRDTLEDALNAPDGHEELGPAARAMMLRAMRFSALRVNDIMVPRADIVSIDETESVSELLRMFDNAGVSRIPLYRETLDDPRGMVHIKDLVRWMMGDSQGRPATEGRVAIPTKQVAGGSAPAAPIVAAPVVAPPTAPSTEPSTVDLGKADLSKSIASSKLLKRQMLYVPSSMPAMDLLVRMQTQQVHMALVVDEYGGTDGLVTIEDLVEQIVGDIEDEHDQKEAANITADPKFGLIAAARTPVAELEQKLGVKLLADDEAAEIDTLGGLVFSIVGRVPARHEVVKHASGVEFEIIDVDSRRVKKVRVIAAGSRPRAATTGAAE